MGLDQSSAAFDSVDFLHRLDLLCVPPMVAKLGHQVLIATFSRHKCVVRHVSHAVAAVVQTSVHQLLDSGASFPRKSLFGDCF